MERLFVMIRFKAIFFYAMLIVSFQVKALFVAAQRFVHRNGNIIECFSDIHMPCQDARIADEQRQQIIDYARDHNAYIIVEDMNARYRESACAQDIDTTCTTPLDDLSLYCAKHGIDCANVEFRELSAASLAGLDISGREVIPMFDGVVEQAAGYNDNLLLNWYYAQTLENLFQAHQSLIDNLRSSDATLKEYCADHNKELEDTVNLFDCRLLDMRILHEVYRNKHRSCIMICAGANHITRIVPLLRKLGYKPALTVQKEVDILDDALSANSAILPKDYLQQSVLLPNSRLTYQDIVSWAC